MKQQDITCVLEKLSHLGLAIRDANGNLLEKSTILELVKLSTEPKKNAMLTYDELRAIEKKYHLSYPFIPNIVDYEASCCCKGICPRSNRFMPCGRPVIEGHALCKTCIKKMGANEELADFHRRMATEVGKYDKRELGLATFIAKGKSKETKVMEDITIWVNKEIHRYKEGLGVYYAHKLSEYHCEIDWERINLTGNRGRPPRAIKTVVYDTQDVSDGEDYFQRIIQEAEFIEEDYEENSDTESCDEIEVIKYEHNDGSTYYIHEECGDVYDIDVNIVGKYDSETKEMTLLTSNNTKQVED
jgi:hypothetical protein